MAVSAISELIIDHWSDGDTGRFGLARLQPLIQSSVVLSGKHGGVVVEYVMRQLHVLHFAQVAPHRLHDGGLLPSPVRAPLPSKMSVSRTRVP